MRNYKDLQVWAKAHELTLALYRETRKFPADERFGLASQIRRAAASVGANLAEGCGRRSDGEMSRYIQIAMGSATELSYHLLLARDLGFIHSDRYTRLREAAEEVLKMLSALSDRVRSAAAAKS